jgi:hypothetical protein
VASAVHPTFDVNTSGVVLFVVALMLPASVPADEPAGDVLIALAEATPTDPRPVKSPSLLTERIEARDRVFARLLFGGRVMILAREGSRLSITEVAGATTIQVERGRVAVTVDRENLHPEDLVEVRTAHAVVTVPSSTLVVEVAEASTFTAVGRSVDVFRVDPVSGVAVEPPTNVAANEVVTVEPARMSSGVVANR